MVLKNRFPILPSKTYLVIFKKRNPNPNIQPLFFQNFQTLSRDSTKLLGIHFDEKLLVPLHQNSQRKMYLRSQYNHIYKSLYQEL